MVCIGIANSGRKKLQEKQRAILAKQNSLAEKSQRELERAIEIIAGPSNKGQTTTILSQSRQQTQNAQIPTGSTDIDFQCERCGQKLSIDSSWRDSIVECPLCKRNTAVS
jgi:ribosomal protein L44E